MIVLSLSGPWRFRQIGREEWLPASVPGEVYTDLLAAGRIPDPFVGMNETAVGWVAEQDWEYRREFIVTADLLAQERVTLVCTGLDTLAELTLNGHPLGTADNMFRTYRWEVKPWLVEGANTLTIVFRSPTAWTRRRYAERPLPAAMNRGAAYLRKAQYHFGWDWGPVLPTCGIWRDIYLEAASVARLADVRLRQHHRAGQVEIEATVTLERISDLPCRVMITVFSPTAEVVGQTIAFPAGASVTARIPVPDPQLWWPAGYGEQPLYKVEVVVRPDLRSPVPAADLIDSASYTIGLRTVELRREPDAWGQSFTFAVNGVPIFARGANWIPADAFPTRVSAERLDRLIGSVAAANMNMLRVWGGGYYESDTFYDLCDRRGILVWQDFMFACAVYPLDDPEFVENVRAEVAQTVRRLRHHACLALWCGNNEIEVMWPVFRIRQPAVGRLAAAHADFFTRLLPGWVQAEDGDRPYWPGSPSSGGFLTQVGATPNADSHGDTHLWNVWHGLQPPEHFRSRPTRFCSEFGLESLPPLETVAAFAGAPDRHLHSPTLRHHQRSPGGNDKMLYYLTDRFPVPSDFADLVYLTQIVQAEGVRIGVEQWRRNRPRCMGALYWQLNDCWPALSWSSLDYFGRWKALHYAARRFNAAVALSLEVVGHRVTACLSNETRHSWRGVLRWSLETFAGEVVEGGEEPAAAAPLTAAPLRRFDFAGRLRERDRRNLVFVAELWQGESQIGRQIALFAAERDLRLPDPGLTAEVMAGTSDDEMVIAVRSRALARFVMLALAGADVVFSDNFFDLPGQRTAFVSCRLPAGWTAADGRQALRIRSLADVRPAGPAWRGRAIHILIGLQPRNLLMRWAMALIK